MSYSQRLTSFNDNLTDTINRGKEIAGQAAQLKALNRDPKRSVFDKVNDSVSTVAGIGATGGMILNTYQHGKLTTHIQKYELSKLTGKGGNSGLENAGNEKTGLIDAPRNVSSGVAPNSESVQLPESANGSSSLDSLKGRVMGNQEDGAQSTDLGKVVSSKSMPESEISNDAFDPQTTAPAAVKSAVGDARSEIMTDASGNFQRVGTGAAESALKDASTTLTKAPGTESMAGTVEQGAASIAKAAASKLGESTGTSIADGIAGGLEAAAPEVGVAAPVLAAVGGLIQLGTTIAGLLHKNKAPPPVTAAAQPAPMQIAANLSEIKS